MNLNPASTLFQKRWPGLLLILAVVILVLAPWPQTLKPPVDRYYRIEASRYAYQPSEIKVNQGDRITIDLVSTDVVHGLSIDGLDVQVIADPGQTARVSFIASQAGSFRFRCTVTCGNLHPFMLGKLRVGANSILLKGVLALSLAATVGFWSLARR